MQVGDGVLGHVEQVGNLFYMDKLEQVIGRPDLIQRIGQVGAHRWFQAGIRCGFVQGTFESLPFRPFELLGHIARQMRRHGQPSLPASRATRLFPGCAHKTVNDLDALKIGGVAQRTCEQDHLFPPRVFDMVENDIHQPRAVDKFRCRQKFGKVLVNEGHFCGLVFRRGGYFGQQTTALVRTE